MRSLTTRPLPSQSLDVFAGKLTRASIECANPPLALLARDHDDILCVEAQFALFHSLKRIQRNVWLNALHTACSTASTLSIRMTRCTPCRDLGVRRLLQYLLCGVIANQLDVGPWEPAHLPIQLARPPAVALPLHSNNFPLGKRQLVLFSSFPGKYRYCTQGDRP